MKRFLLMQRINFSRTHLQEKECRSVPASLVGWAVKLTPASNVVNSVPDAFMCPTRQMIVDSVSMVTSVNSSSTTVDGAGITSRRTVNRMMSVK